MKKLNEHKQTRKPTAVRREEIIDAGMHILSEEGARQFTAERLGAAVGITGGTIFRHFASMDEILDAIVDRIEEIIFENFPPEAADPLESLRLFFEARVRAITEHPEVSKLLLTSTLVPNGDANVRAKRLGEFKLRSRSFVVDCLRRAKADGLLDGDVTHEESSVLVIGAIYALGHMGATAKSASNAGVLAKRVWRLIESSIRAGA
jgi:AcrR family transcriptional regulator